MSRRQRSRGNPVEMIEVLSIVPVTARKGLRVSRVRQNGVTFAELRAIGLDPEWQPSPKDHRSVVRSEAVGRVIAALMAFEAKIGGEK